MDFDELVHWAQTKNCQERRNTGTCDHDACEENEQAIALLESAVDLDTTDVSGNRIQGKLITS